MPATQVVDVFDGLEFRVEPVEEPNPVYFTDDAPKFQVRIKNNNAKYEFTDDSRFTWVIETHPGQIVHTDEVEFGPLDNGEELSVTVGDKTLAYEGHGVLGISVGGASGQRNNTRRKLAAGRGEGANPAYSFSVWDESNYNASVKRPKQLQKALIGTSFVLIFFALIQLLVASGVIP